jgi:hypothetical protein
MLTRDNTYCCCPMETMRPLLNYYHIELVVMLFLTFTRLVLLKLASAKLEVQKAHGKTNPTFSIIHLTISVPIPLRNNGRQQRHRHKSTLHLDSKHGFLAPGTNTHLFYQIRPGPITELRKLLRMFGECLEQIGARASD